MACRNAHRLGGAAWLIGPRRRLLPIHHPHEPVRHVAAQHAACGTGFISTNAYNTVAHGQAATWSYQHGCDMTPSTASAGTFAAQAQFHKSGGGGTYAICAQTLVGTNGQGAWVTAVDGFFDPCGSGTYRIQARWRMTYGGTNWHGAANTPYYYMVD